MKKYILFGLIIFFNSSLFAQFSITDIEGNIYKTTIIGNQIWMSQNLNTSYFSNGKKIENVTDNLTWGEYPKSAYCNYNNDSNISKIYGKLYNYFSVIDENKICPIGWHVPSDNEWSELVNYLGGENVAGKHIKEKGNKHWKFPFGGGDNQSEFTALPSGYRWSNIGLNKGLFNSLTYGASFWTSTDSTNNISIWRYLYPESDAIARLANDRNYGLSVRCISDIKLDEIKEQSNESILLIFPNPSTSGRIEFILLKGECSKIQLFNLFGQLLLEQKFNNYLELSNYPNTEYILRLTTTNGVLIRKILLNKQ
jgi:uncharacterized protein (TIGR02145 family)